MSNYHYSITGIVATWWLQVAKPSLKVPAFLHMQGCWLRKVLRWQIQLMVSVAAAWRGNCHTARVSGRVNPIYSHLSFVWLGWFEHSVPSFDDFCIHQRFQFFSPIVFACTCTSWCCLQTDRRAQNPCNLNQKATHRSINHRILFYFGIPQAWKYQVFHVTKVTC